MRRYNADHIAQGVWACLDTFVNKMAITFFLTCTIRGGPFNFEGGWFWKNLSCKKLFDEKNPMRLKLLKKISCTTVTKKKDHWFSPSLSEMQSFNSVVIQRYTRQIQSNSQIISFGGVKFSLNYSNQNVFVNLYLEISFYLTKPFFISIN